MARNDKRRDPTLYSSYQKSGKAVKQAKSHDTSEAQYISQCSKALAASKLSELLRQLDEN